MKKLVALLLIMLFGVASSGAAVQLHYCCGKLKSISLGSAKEKDCCMQEEMNSKTCCETKSISAKAEEQDHNLYTITSGSATPVVPGIFYQHISFAFPVEQVTILPALHGTYLLSEQIFIRNCVFRI